MILPISSQCKWAVRNRLAWRKQSRQEGYEEPVEDGMEESSNGNTTVPPLKQGHGGSLNAGRLGINDALGY